MVILRAGVGSLVIDENFLRSFRIQELLNLLAIGLIAEDSVLHRVSSYTDKVLLESE